MCSSKDSPLQHLTILDRMRLSSGSMAVGRHKEKVQEDKVLAHAFGVQRCPHLRHHPLWLSL